jgi:D-hydroxyproline dehydrogenase subunit alpha
VTASYRARGTEPGSDGVEFEFEGRIIRGRRGESLAAALIAAGEREFRILSDGARRGLFCGMGVCQECLVEIEGRPAQRACMTKLDGLMRVRRRSFLPIARAVGDGAAPDIKLETLEPDILVLGGGAGGLNAAMAAARAGAKVLLVDERPVAGGQFYKQRLDAIDLAGAVSDDDQFAGGRALIAKTAAAGVTMMQGAQIWGAFEPLDLMLFDGKASRLCRPKRLIVATGAYERGLPVPGWTLPGVMTTGAAQTLLRSYGVLAGKSLLIAGHGPLNLQVALELALAGAQVVAVAELARKPGLWSAEALLRMLTSAPSLLLQGQRYVAELARRGIPLLHGHVLAGVEQTQAGLKARLGRWPGDSAAASPSYDVDAVLMGYGFMPSNEILRALGCNHRFDPVRGHLVCERDAECLTSTAAVYAVGDCAGLGGARAAEAEGAIAGMAAAVSTGLSAPSDLKRDVAAARAALRRHRQFQAALWQLFAAPRPLTELAQSGTAVCSCEGLTLAEIEQGFADGPRGIGAIKRATRAGMGRCQGRYCGPVLAAMAAGREGLPLDEAAYWAPRPPIKPMAITDIIAGGMRN